MGPARSAARNLPFFLAALLYGAPTIAYPFGRDQAIFYYVGREWLRGRMPYRDAFDMKPPAIYALNALAILVFGEHQWGIRIFDVVAVLAIGGLAARIVAHSRREEQSWWGPISLIAVALYVSSFDFWDTAQVEIFESLALLGGFYAASAAKSRRRATLISGALVAVACMFKPVALLPGLVPLGIVAAREWRSAPSGRWRAALLASLEFMLGGTAIVATVLVYAAAHSILRELLDVVPYVAHYMRHKGGGVDPLEWTRRVWLQQEGLFTFAIAVAFALAVRARDDQDARPRQDSLLAGALLAGSVASVIVQWKFWPYHWVVTIAPAVLVIAFGFAEAMRSARLPTLVAVWALAVVSFAGGPSWIANRNTSSHWVAKQTWSYWFGWIEREEYLASFINEHVDYAYAPEEHVGELIRSHAQPGDELIVRGFEPAIYVVSGLGSPSRFASDSHITDPSVSYRRAEWLRLHEQECWGRSRPRFVVTFVARTDDVASIKAKGYHELAIVERFVVLEREPQT
jgi:hypothetical protein